MLLAILRICCLVETRVEHVIAPLLRIPERLEQLAQDKYSAEVRHRTRATSLVGRAGVCKTEGDKANEIAAKIRALLS